MNDLGHTTQLNKWLDVARSGNVDARNEIIDHVCERLRLLTRRMLRGNPKVKRWSETDDVLQAALIRLHRSLADIKPESARQFYGLAATQIRRELIDLARSHYGPHGVGANHHTDGGEASERKLEEQIEPESLEAWAKFHETVEELPGEQKAVVDLLWYEGVSQPEAAKLLGVSLATVKRRWQAARVTLFENLKELEF